MNKALGIAMLAVGVALIVFGVNESESFRSDVSRILRATRPINPCGCSSPALGRRCWVSFDLGRSAKS